MKIPVIYKVDGNTIGETLIIDDFEIAVATAMYGDQNKAIDQLVMDKLTTENPKAFVSIVKKGS